VLQIRVPDTKEKDDEEGWDNFIGSIKEGMNIKLLN
jgi:hypothetical protein